MTSCLSQDAALALIGGKTAGPTRRANEAHLATCADCRAAVANLARTRSAASRRASGAGNGAGEANDAQATGPAQSTPRAAPRSSPLAMSAVNDDRLALAATVLSPAAERSTPPVLPGEVVGGKYEVEWPIGAGGMGVVVAAVHTVLGHRVAIKFPLPEMRWSSDGHERLLREARACVQLRSEYAVRLLDVGTLDDRSPYVVMEYLVGRTLGERLVEEGPLPLSVAVDSLVQACEALEEAHAKGIVHRDLKPSNLFETHRFDGSRVVKVLDFGIAKAPAFRGEQPLTITRDVMGSPAYMAPEQLRSTRDVDARADIWALGVSLRELLTGKVDEASVSPAGVDRIIRRCLELDPAKRYPSARELAVALAPFGSDVSTGIAARLVVEPSRGGAGARNTWLIALGLILVAAVASALWFRPVPPPSVIALSPAAPPPAVVSAAPSTAAPPSPPSTAISAATATPPPVPGYDASTRRPLPTPRTPPHPTPIPIPTSTSTPPAQASTPPAPPDSPDPHGLSDRK